MPQPRELPGFYYDVEKNRYFPIKGPIPGSSRSSSSSSKPTAPKSPQLTSSTKEGKSSRRKLRNNMSKLLQARELDGHVIASRSHNFKCNFTEELRKIQASQPVVWKYKGMDSINISALEQMHIDVLTQQGQYKTDVLLTGSMDGSVR
ncbi:hypothetical protein RIF29_04062 [Crotalaria pallida]|uniref:Uncharacterized protein n=1 Tax=Crotalaria pallida TaxID=3830 RepID=A0AAN9J1D9_CROPI